MSLINQPTVEFYVSHNSVMTTNIKDDRVILDGSSIQVKDFHLS